MKKEPEQIFQELKQDVTAFVELKVEFLKLEIFERAGKGISALSFGVILALLAFFLILFLFVSLGFFLGELLNSFGVGFILVSALCLLLIGIVYLLRKQLQDKIQNIVIDSFMTSKKQESNENATNTISKITE